MGQSITVQSKPIDGFCVFTTDRVLTGQDGARFESADEASAGEGFVAELAAGLFAGDDAIDNVYIASNDVIVGRSADWDDTTSAAAASIIENLYRFYND